MNEQEKKIQEARTLEAIKKNMGEKLRCIVINLGQEIIGENSVEGFGMETSYLEENDKEEDKDEIPYAWEQDEPEGQGWNEDRKETVKEVVGGLVGYYFEGLSNGIHLEIKLMSDSKLVASYKGYEVFREETGELMGYNPFAEWEGIVERLYDKAKKIDKRAKKAEQEASSSEANRLKSDWLRKIRDRWGV
jgi:hypothetical protein